MRLSHVRTLEISSSSQVSIIKVPSRYQLGDLLTEPQPRDLFESQRESVLQWESEHVERQELELPGKHLRACEIIESLPDLVEQEAFTKHSKVVQPAIPVHSSEVPRWYLGWQLRRQECNCIWRRKQFLEKDNSRT